MKVRTFREIIVDFLRFVTTLDGKMWLTLKTLFLRPGELTLAFERGQHAKYIMPWRLVFLTVVLSLLMGAVLPDNSPKSTDFSNQQRFSSFAQNAVLHETYNRLDSIAQTQPDSVQRGIRVALGMLDTMNGIGRISRDSFWCLGPAGGYNFLFYSDTIAVAKHDFFWQNDDALREKYGLNWFQIRAVSNTFANTAELESRSSDMFEKNMSWILLAHAVVFAGFMALFYRRKAWQMHFVFNLHTACFFTLSIQLMEVLPYNSGIRLGLYFVILMIYNWYSYRHFYQPKGWRRYAGFAAYTTGFFLVFMSIVVSIIAFWDRIM